MSKVKGKVKWFNADKNYGFIASDEDQKEFFVHGSNTTETLKEGQDVLFTVGQGRKGEEAKDVEIVGE